MGTISGGHLLAKALKAEGLKAFLPCNVVLDPDIYSSGAMNQTMYK